ncbi:MAG: hypothetical protein IPG64_16690 [Haliea sp.]|nr:hypothetical protein [Haliea sp.]
MTDLDKGRLFSFNQLTFATALDMFIPGTNGTGSHRDCAGRARRHKPLDVSNSHPRFTTTA